MHFVRTDSQNQDFIALVKLLDADLAIRDGDEHPFYAQFNKLDKIKHVVVLFEDEIAIACGAIKEFSPQIMEVKRMFTLPEYRGKGLASVVLRELETWAVEMGYQKCILETGHKQVEALKLYHKSGYMQISNYGQYEGKENSLCFEKFVTGNL